MLRNKTFSTKSNRPEEEEFVFDTEIDVDDATNVDVKKDITLLQCERKKANSKLNEIKSFFKSLDWNSMQEQASTIKSTLHDVKSQIKLHAATIESLCLSNLQQEKQVHSTSFKNECCVMSMKEKQVLLQDLQQDFAKELKAQRELFVVQLELERQKHLQEIQNLTKQYQSQLKQPVRQAQNQQSNPLPIPNPIPSTTIPTTTNTSSNPTSTSTHIPAFGPSPNQHKSNSGTSNNPINLFNDYRVTFNHQGSTYTLQEREFLKSSPSLQAPLTEDDTLSLYSSLQKHALIYNIFITPIDQVAIWDLAPGSVPTTCNLDPVGNNNFHQAYQQMATAIFSKLNKVKYDKVPFFSNMIDYKKATQDGYRVLYAFLTCCHPKLVQRTKMDIPKMVPNGNFFSFMRMFNNWLEYEKIAQRNYSDIENLSVVIDVLKTDGRFEKALSTINMQKQLYEQMCKLNKNQPIPRELTVDIIPYTIMNAYESDEKRDLFSDSNETDAPTINRLNNDQNNNRQRGPPQRNAKFRMPVVQPLGAGRARVDEVCKGCGNFGHSVFKNGCDFIANHIRATRFIESNPNMIEKILRYHAQHQARRALKLTGKTIAQRMEQLAKNRRLGLGPTVRALFDVVGETLESVMFEDEEETIDTMQDLEDELDAQFQEEFHDANRSPPSSPQH